MQKGKYVKKERSRAATLDWWTKPLLVGKKTKGTSSLDSKPLQSFDSDCRLEDLAAFLWNEQLDSVFTFAISADLCVCVDSISFIPNMDEKIKSSWYYQSFVTGALRLCINWKLLGNYAHSAANESWKEYVIVIVVVVLISLRLGKRSSSEKETPSISTRAVSKTPIFFDRLSHAHKYTGYWMLRAGRKIEQIDSTLFGWQTNIVNVLETVTDKCICRTWFTTKSIEGTHTRGDKTRCENSQTHG